MEINSIITLMNMIGFFILLFMAARLMVHMQNLVTQNR